MTRSKILFWGFLLIMVGIQFIPVDLSNPPVTGEMRMTLTLKSALKKACYDCHSNETVFPWYSKVAPVSLFIEHDINDGRKALNFSEWNNYSFFVKQSVSKEIISVLKEKTMPPSLYTFMHVNSNLTPQEKKEMKEFFDRR